MKRHFEFERKSPVTSSQSSLLLHSSDGQIKLNQFLKNNITLLLLGFFISIFGFFVEIIHSHIIYNYFMLKIFEIIVNIK